MGRSCLAPAGSELVLSIKRNQTATATKQTMSEEDSQHVKRTDEGASIQLEMTRGTETRDQEKWRIKGKGETADQAIEEFKQSYSAVTGEDPEHLAEHAREFDPQRESSDENGN